MGDYRVLRAELASTIKELVNPSTKKLVIADHRGIPLVEFKNPSKSLLRVSRYVNEYSKSNAQEFVIRTES